jgi:hypothetical protein
MENTVYVNQEVSIVAYYFKNGLRRLKCFPKKMEYRGRIIEFIETGLRHPTKKGQRMIHVFDMTDGTADYRLEFDAEALTWTLVAISDISETAKGLDYAKLAAANQ